VTLEPQGPGGGQGPRLRARRLAVGLTQEELADRSGLSVRTIRDLERGSSRPRPRTVTSVAAALGVAEAELATARPPAKAAAVRPHVPRQLPAVVHGFVGREPELAALTGLLGQAGNPGVTVVISAISGTAGVGKTALALRWAHQVAAEFPDGQLYVNLRGYDFGSPMPVTEALAGFLRGLGVPGEDIPATEDERAARYRSLLAGRRTLVLLDNASEVQQVRPLLPGSQGCVAVVTSRDDLAGLVARDGASRLDLDLLPARDADTLLRELIGARAAADPDATAALAGLCARLPLALRVAAEYAAASPSVSLASLVGELRDTSRLDFLDPGGDPRAAVRTVFSWSYRHLDHNTARAFRLLSLHPGPDLDVYAAAALTGGPAGQAARLIRTLAGAYLVQPAAGKRYAMHDLLRAYARELAGAQDGPEEERAALTRLFDHYLHTASAAMDILHPAERDSRPRLPGLPPTSPDALAWPAPHMGPPVTSPDAALAWLDEQRACLVAAIAYAAGHGWAWHATRLAATLYRYLDASGHVPEADVVHGHALRAARELGDPAEEARALSNLGFVHAAQGRYQEAASDLNQALALYREIGDRHGQAVALGNLGFIRLYQGLYRQAVQELQQALALHRQTGDRIGEARTLNRLGSMELRQGRYAQAASYLRRALGLFRDHGEPSDLAFALANLGRIDIQKGRYGHAASSLAEALALFRGLSHPTGESYALLFLGRLDLREGRYSEAADHHQQALALSRVTGRRHDEAEVLAGLGEVELGQGHLTQADGYLRQAVTLFREVGDISGEASVLNPLGQTLLASGQPGAARDQHLTALDLASQHGDRYEQARAHDGLGRACRVLGDAVGAASHWRQALAIYTEVGVPEADEVRTFLAGTGQAT
jgi:tetratricopeptide (TPR) repeat protein/DNA-binding XRE family transcriptional regulator